MTTIIGVSGKIASGKDYLTEKLVGELTRRGYSYAHTAFAAPLKAELDEIIRIIHLNLGFNDERIADAIAQQMDMEHSDGLLLVGHLREELTRTPSLTAYSRTVAIRQVLQDLGTTIRRRQNPTYWTDLFVEFVENSNADFVFASDARFPNEMDTVVDNDGFAIRLDIPEEVLAERRNRRDGIIYTPEQLNHVSETSLDDYEKFDLYVGVQFDAAEIVDSLLKKAESFQASSLEALSAGFPKGTNVATYQGHKQVEDIEPNDWVYTLAGHYPVRAVDSHVTRSSVTLFIDGALPITAHDEQKFLARKNKQDTDTSWVSAKDIQTGWYVAQSAEWSLLDKEMMNPYGHHENQFEGPYGFATLMGVLVQCGTYTLNSLGKPSFTTSHNTKEFKDLLTELKCEWEELSNKRLLVHHPDITDLVLAFGDNKWTQYVPELIHQKPYEWKVQFLDGVFSSSEDTGCSIRSKDLALGIARLVRSVDSINEVRVSATGYSKWQIAVVPRASHLRSSRIEWLPIVKTTIRNETSGLDVYNIQLISPHGENYTNYLADGYFALS